MAQAKRDAATLRQHKSRNKNKSVHHILASRSWVQLKETFKIYKKKYSKQFDVDINSDIKPEWVDYKVAILTIYQYAMDGSILFFARALLRDVYWCTPLYLAYDKGIARVFIWRAEMDLGGIAKDYALMQGWPLAGLVKYCFDEDATNTLVGILQ